MSASSDSEVPTDILPERSSIAFTWYAGNSGSAERMLKISDLSAFNCAQRTTSTIAGILEISISSEGNSEGTSEALISWEDGRMTDGGGT